MCKSCGCSEVATHEHHHPHDHDAHVPHRHEPGGTVIRLEEKLLAKNDRLAAENRTWFSERGILALNLVSSPGAGKTTLLERTIYDLGSDMAIQVIEGDQATDHDAQRIRAAGARAVQINTGAGCHLDATMVARGARELGPAAGSVMMIENVGNLVCPALFDLGERAKVVVCSVTEGDDKPVKYPHMFRAGSLVLLNKIDLLPYVAFDLGRFRERVRQVNPRLEILLVSATRGDGLAGWYGWVRAQRSLVETVVCP